MAGKFFITEDKSDTYKFRCMVSFNDKTAEYYELDYVYDGEGLVDKSFINDSLQLTADSDYEKAMTEAGFVAVEIVDGKLG